MRQRRRLPWWLRVVQEQVLVLVQERVQGLLQLGLGLVQAQERVQEREQAQRQPSEQ